MHQVSAQTSEGGFPASMGEVKEPRHSTEELVHWCHGAPGTVQLLVRAHQVWGEEEHLTASLRAADLVWRKGENTSQSLL